MEQQISPNFLKFWQSSFLFLFLGFWDKQCCWQRGLFALENWPEVCDFYFQELIPSFLESAISISPPVKEATQILYIFCLSEFPWKVHLLFWHSPRFLLFSSSRFLGRSSPWFCSCCSFCPRREVLESTQVLTTAPPSTTHYIIYLLKLGVCAAFACQGT